MSGARIADVLTPTDVEEVRLRTFDREHVVAVGLPPADLLAPGHPLLDATIDLVLDRHRALLKRGTVLIADADPREVPRALVYLEDAIQSAASAGGHARRIVSRQLRFVEVDADDAPALAGSAPYLDYRPPTEEETRSASTPPSWRPCAPSRRRTRRAPTRRTRRPGPPRTAGWA